MPVDNNRPGTGDFRQRSTAHNNITESKLRDISVAFCKRCDFLLEMAFACHYSVFWNKAETRIMSRLCHLVPIQAVLVTQNTR